MNKVLIPSQNGAKTPPFWAAHTYMAYIGEYTTYLIYFPFFIHYYNFSFKFSLRNGFGRPLVDPLQPKQKSRLSPVQLGAIPCRKPVFAQQNQFRLISNSQLL